LRRGSLARVGEIGADEGREWGRGKTGMGMNPASLDGRSAGGTRSRCRDGYFLKPGYPVTVSGTDVMLGFLRYGDHFVTNLNWRFAA